ncbi:MAG TPA: N-acetylmuramoyl-L-alanine amidase, partial [Candidatus Eisenbacteria bacterium]|nr:N-acetylmuramoyl-L-alanine amidase [Candidatus Eisenbacteria bacterium]
AGASSALTLTAVRSFSGPENTRIVFEFSRPAEFVFPDSGQSRQLTIAIPAEATARAAGVQASLLVRDGVVDSVEIETRVDGANFRLWFRDSAPFKVLTLPAQDDQPFRLVVEVSRPGAEQLVERRAEGIAQVKRRDRVLVVAVDAGHGGEDAGAKGPRKLRVFEKNVTLAMARALVEELNRIPGVRGELTRDGDYFIPLRDRYHLAEKMKADLFISIHTNSSRRRSNSARGTEVYFLSLRGASDQADADLADTENAADMVGGVPPQAENDLVNILYDVKRTAALEHSQLLAETLLDHIAVDRRLESRGIKQAGFVVLKSVEFPSVLVETAFINNPVEARLLMSKEFQRKMAKQLAEGVRKYFGRNGRDLPLGADGTR